MEEAAGEVEAVTGEGYAVSDAPAAGWWKGWGMRLRMHWQQGGVRGGVSGVGCTGNRAVQGVADAPAAGAAEVWRQRHRGSNLAG